MSVVFVQSQENCNEEEELEVPRRLTEIIQKGSVPINRLNLHYIGTLKFSHHFTEIILNGTGSVPINRLNLHYIGTLKFFHRFTEIILNVSDSGSINQLNLHYYSRIFPPFHT
jgi:hypothetical protein